jgi:hypothetical protein
VTKGNVQHDQIEYLYSCKIYMQICDHDTLDHKTKKNIPVGIYPTVDKMAIWPRRPVSLIGMHWSFNSFLLDLLPSSPPLFACEDDPMPHSVREASPVRVPSLPFGPILPYRGVYIGNYSS